ncbi:hypothetical protein IGJ34_001351 [Enterococcus sp. AZ177]
MNLCAYIRTFYKDTLYTKDVCCSDIITFRYSSQFRQHTYTKVTAVFLLFQQGRGV